MTGSSDVGETYSEAVDPPENGAAAARSSLRCRLRKVENSRTYADALEADGHFVVRCEHNLGHSPPDEAADMALIFFDAHVRGADEPWLDGLPETLPSWCQ